VLKTEHESLQNFLKESSEKETKSRKELEEKHAQAMSELAEKLKKSNQRIKTLASKTKAYETEAENINKMIFRKDFTFLPVSSLRSFRLTSREKLNMPFCSMSWI
jgi:chromosome segregation ATPase